MSFNGIWVWDAKHGVPSSYEEAFALTEQLSNSEQKEINPAFQQYGKDLSEFAKQAEPFYGEEVEDYLDYEDYLSDYQEIIIGHSSIPMELAQDISAIMVHSAEQNNLVILNAQIEVVFLPDGSVLTENQPEIWEGFAAMGIEGWQKKLEKLQNQAETDDDSLPETKAAVKKLINQTVKDRLKEAGIKGIKKPELT